MASMLSIFFIGGGNMATSIIKGLQSEHWKITVAEIYEPQREKLAKIKHLNIVSRTDDPSILDADVIMLSIKPQSIKEVIQILEPLDLSNKIIVSIMAGVSISQYQLSGSNIRYVRTMPNLPILTGLGFTGIYCQDISIRPIIERIFSNTSKMLYLEEESALNKVTAISGSGPGYFFAFIESLIKAAVELGFSQEDAKNMAIQTALGASTMASQSSESIATLRANVTSKGGTTEQALISFQNDHLDQIVSNAVNAANRRGEELALINDQH